MNLGFRSRLVTKKHLHVELWQPPFMLNFDQWTSSAIKQ